MNESDVSPYLTNGENSSQSNVSFSGEKTLIWGLCSSHDPHGIPFWGVKPHLGPWKSGGLTLTGGLQNFFLKKSSRKRPTKMQYRSIPRWWISNSVQVDPGGSSSCEWFVRPRDQPQCFRCKKLASLEGRWKKISPRNIEPQVHFWFGLLNVDVFLSVQISPLSHPLVFGVNFPSTKKHLKLKVEGRYQTLQWKLWSNTVVMGIQGNPPMPTPRRNEALISLSQKDNGC